ncbi:MAG TPA: glycosyltransferase [Bauldia sp.]|nr:glycosyltransferase [Bauldia sp.]
MPAPANGRGRGEPARPPVAVAAEAVATLPCAIDHFAVSSGGRALVVGWVDDRAGRVDGLGLLQNGRLVHKPGLRIHRFPRVDAARHLGADEAYGFGFWAVFRLPGVKEAGDPRLVLTTGAGRLVLPQAAKWVTDAEMRALVLGFVSIRAGQLGHPPVGRAEYETVLDVVGEISGEIGREARATVQVTRFDTVEKPDVSLVVVLYRNCSFLYPQARLIAGALRALDAELIVVNNSPETWHEARHEVRRIHETLGVSVRLVQPKGNLGFGGGNNAGVAASRGEHLVLINPDVIPYATEDLVLFARALRKKTLRKTILGARLLYDDGSLMHDGMELFLDEIPDRAGGEEDGVVDRLVRVEHIGKGDPPMIETDRLRDEIADVEAITGALMGMKRAFFEELGGFDERYLFGHYEDVDLCCRARRAGGRVAVHRGAYLYHLEGKSSDFSAPQVAGAVAMNRIRCSVMVQGGTPQ